MTVDFFLVQSEKIGISSLYAAKKRKDFLTQEIEYLSIFKNLLLAKELGSEMKQEIARLVSRIDRYLDEYNTELERWNSLSLNYLPKQIEFNEGCIIETIQLYNKFCEEVEEKFVKIQSLEQQDSKIAISFNYKVIGKIKQDDKEGFYNLTTSYVNEFKTPEEIMLSIHKGYAWCPSHFDGRRNTKNFVCSEIIGLDFDGGITLSEALNDDFIKNNALLLYTTASHTEQHHKFRVILKLPRLITDREEYKKIISMLLEKYPNSDKACKDPCRAFYGSIGCKYKIIGRTFQGLYSEMERYNKKHTQIAPMPKRIITKDNNLNVAYDILSFLPPHLPYDEYLTIPAALSSEFGNDVAKEIIITSGKWQDKELQDTIRKIPTFDGSVTMGSLVHLAKKYGWSRKMIS